MKKLIILCAALAVVSGAYAQSTPAKPGPCLTIKTRFGDLVDRTGVPVSTRYDANGQTGCTNPTK